MTPVPWYQDVAIIISLIAVATGIYGAVVGHIAYRRTNQIKALDMRLELRKSVADARLELLELQDLIRRVDGSRIAVATANGTLRTGGIEAWKSGCHADGTEVGKLTADVPNEGHDYAAMSESELEALQVKVHRLRTRGRQLHQKYSYELALDDKQREEIRARHNQRQDEVTRRGSAEG